MSITDRLTRHPPVLLFAGLVAFAASAEPAAAETLTCTAISALPAVITTQGTYCLKKDLATAMASGMAIDIQTNNVTLDCNGYKLGNLAAGPSTLAYGIWADGRSNISVRGCNVRGFRFGILLVDEADIEPVGALVEDNRVEGSIQRGITVIAKGSVIRRNLVRGIGGSAVNPSCSGIFAGGSIDVLDNTVDGVACGAHVAYGLYLNLALDRHGMLVAGNRIRNIHSDSLIIGIRTYAQFQPMLRDNSLVNPPSAVPNHAFYCEYGGMLIDNAAIGFANSATNCAPGIDNVFLPAVVPG